MILNGDHVHVELAARGRRFNLYYPQGGRLADVFVNHTLVGTIRVSNYDWCDSRQRLGLSHTDLTNELAEWIAESGDRLHDEEAPH